MSIPNAAAPLDSSTPFDYIVVGSGAGGGPLAARLAESGATVLLIEAGDDAARVGPGDERLRAIYEVPGFHAAATEDPETSWDFSVRHYACTAKQARDEKYVEAKDPSRNGGTGNGRVPATGTGGVFYPRCASLGGCTAHHAMIMARPNDGDWDRIADLTGNDRWRSENMQGYFGKIENCLYYKTYEQTFKKWFGIAYRWPLKIAGFLNPRNVLDTEGHGFAGWQPTSLIDPVLISRIAQGDKTFLRLLFRTLLANLGTKSERSILRRALERFKLVALLDPNARSRGLEQRARVALIPLATRDGCRSAVRERILDVHTRLPKNLQILTHALATRVIFERCGATPKAIGVEVACGKDLYRASKNPAQFPGDGLKQFFAQREVILAGGAFNTPQLLMLSGIGDPAALDPLRVKGPRDAADHEVSGVIPLPGVGRNLQDRYEISVINEATSDFSTLRALTFDPDRLDDPARVAWDRAGHGGLYSTNGGALAILAASDERTEDLQPDLFIFGFSAAFRGYYWGWSKELLKRTMGAGTERRNLWSWVILKAYTRNNGGRVLLRTDCAADPPEINFHSFDEGPDKSGDDVRALLSGVRIIRHLNRQIPVLGPEIQPGGELREGSADLQDWVETQAWGHHACGTCRIGSDVWQADATALKDKEAVLDSEFRVHGVQGLRVVDASVFPHIPGYFIVAPTMMIGEMAADCILADRATYPRSLEEAEAARVRRRREIALLAAAAAPAADSAPKPGLLPGSDRRRALPPAPGPGRLPADTVGIALSGGGIRSATFGLGFLQALAAKKQLRHVDYLSTVSGGGYIGCFLGRLFMRLIENGGSDVADKVERVESRLRDLRSPEVWWLRRNANYIAGQGRSEAATDLAIIWRNLWSVHGILAILAFALFGLAHLLAPGGLLDLLPHRLGPLVLSPWAGLVPLVLTFAILPAVIAYWFHPLVGIRQGGLRTALSWTTLTVGLTLICTQRVSLPFVAALLSAALAWFWHELACQRLPNAPQDQLVAATLVANRLTRALVMSQALLIGSVAWTVLDSLARSAAESKAQWIPMLSALMSGLLTVAPLFMTPAKKLLAQGTSGASPGAFAGLLRTLPRTLLALLLAAVWLFFVDLSAHVVFAQSPEVAPVIVAVAWAVSIAVGGAFAFVNRSSLQPVYTERLSRTFLGASSDARIRPDAGEVPVAVQNAHAKDDINFHDYHPENAGGPLHLINVCVNQTVDLVGARQLGADKGLPMCAGPAGLSVGLRFHSLWDSGTPGALKPLFTEPDPNGFHVLARRDSQPVQAEPLRLGQWMAISGAAYTTGDGRLTSLPVSWLAGFINLRIGYWWNSGIDAGDRPGRYPPALWRRLMSIPGLILRAQSTILNEWRARFLGPGERYWYLSDGGHFECTGIYELLRRRLPFIIAVDSGFDPSYQFEDLAGMVRLARLDFDAEFTWLDPTEGRQGGLNGWAAFTAAAANLGGIPRQVMEWTDPDALGDINQISRNSPQVASLACIRYGASEACTVSWLLYIRAVIPGGAPRDVRTFAAQHGSFPNEPTVNQFFTDAEWESYRAIGAQIGESAIVHRPS